MENVVWMDKCVGGEKKRKKNGLLDRTHVHTQETKSFSVVSEWEREKKRERERERECNKERERVFRLVLWYLASTVEFCQGLEKLATATVSNVVECCVPWVFVGSNGLGEEGRERGSLAGHSRVTMCKLSCMHNLTNQDSWFLWSFIYKALSTFCLMWANKEQNGIGTIIFQARI